MPNQFERINFQSHSCEPGEKNNSIVKKVMKNTTNRLKTVMLFHL